MLCTASRSVSPTRECQRAMKRKATDDLLATMDKRCLVKDFACILCQRICNVPVATTVCMHRFCEECMNPRIAAGNLKCPKCNSQLDRNQPVCHDSNFQDIIKKIDFDLTVVHDLFTRKPHSTCYPLLIASCYRVQEKSVLDKQRCVYNNPIIQNFLNSCVSHAEYFHNTLIRQWFEMVC
ncbi:zinc finger, C3HC4 type [Dictyocaulus viviparus]|uniref:Zinc finger, C3HC4 type n=1 Tax=Dictyocaulus viviparus TaxID=29172 RepID=A0A0D8XZM2_DICVI|nr:zinc finger, C3HC4 type [Dictyocaulus viviparus]